MSQIKLARRTALRPLAHAPLVVSTAHASDASAAAITVPAPATISAGNLLVAYVTEGNFAAHSISLPSGWTLSGSMSPGGNPAGSMFVATKIATGAEPANYTFTLNSGGGTIIGIIVQISGAPAADVGPSFTNDPGGGNNHAAPSLTTTAANDFLVAAWFVNSNSQITVDAAMVEAINDSGDSGCGVAIATQVIAASGATGTRTATTPAFVAGIYASLALLAA